MRVFYSKERELNTKRLKNVTVVFHINGKELDVEAF
jgi:hypothetical protein